MPIGIVASPRTLARPKAPAPRGLPRPAGVLLVGLLLVVVAAALPTAAAAVSSFDTRCSGVSLRAQPSATSTRVATLGAGVRVIAVATVSGGSWSASCDGHSMSGTTWLRITVVAGTSTMLRYGFSQVYGAAGMFRYRSSYMRTACEAVHLRVSPRVGTTTKIAPPIGTRVTSTGTVAGGSWTTSCTGTRVTGSTWYRITVVNGKSVSSLYGVSALYGPKGQVEMAPASAPATHDGIDVSHWQGVIDWSQVAAAGKQFAFLKASGQSSDETYVDPAYPANRAGATANGLKVGAYHYAQPDTTPGDAVGEADHFVDTATPAPGDLLPVLDIEQAGELTVTQLQAWVLAFMDRVHERTGVRGLVYSNPHFWATYLGDTTALATAGYPLWIAHWNVSAPTVPASNWSGQGWTFWQQTATGSVPGIAGAVDLDRYRFDDWTRVLIPAP